MTEEWRVQTMTNHERELAELVSKDAELLKELASWLEAYSHQVEVYGSAGDLEMRKVKDRVPAALKALVNYI
jgi:hypothetical protein